VNAAGNKSLIITRPARSGQQARWQRLLADAVRDPAELLELLDLDTGLLPLARRAARRFPLRVPRGFVARMRPADPHDPLLRQVLPLGDELEAAVGFVADPVGDLAARAGRGVLRKYAGRALLIASGACAVNCRYCFRREFPYADGAAAAGDWSDAADTLAGDGSLREVILSGGDPLTLTNRRLASLRTLLDRLPSVRRLRIHTRLAVVLPERVDAGLLTWARTLPVPLVVVIHSNHANEIDGSVRLAVRALREAGATVLNQSVLLRGVNDCPEALVRLSEALFDAGVLPYYLHMLDRVRGAAHFDVPAVRAAALMGALAARLPGYLVPRLVREEAGATAKTPVDFAAGIVTGSAANLSGAV
jgi:EF-P beta-lysylation protein EpmB